MENRSFKSRFICGMVSGVMAVTGAVSILPVLTSEQNAIIAFAGDGHSTGTEGSGASDYGNTATGEWSLTTSHPQGVRIYLAPKSVMGTDMSIANVSKLHAYVKDAVYSFDNTAYGTDNEGHPTVSYVKSSKYMNDYVGGKFNGRDFKVNAAGIPAKAIVGQGTTGQFDFSSVFATSYTDAGGTKHTFSRDNVGTVSRWRNGDRVDLSGVASWANKMFGSSSNDALSAFIAGYKARVNKFDSGNKLPSNYDEFATQGWVIVVEPVYGLVKKDTSIYLYVSNWDLQHSKQSDGNFSYGKNCFGWHAEDWIEETAKMYPDYTYLGKSFNYSKTPSCKGFGVYWGNGYCRLGDPAKASMNYTLCNSTDAYTFNGNTESSSQEMKINANQSWTVASSDSAKTALSLNDKDKKYLRDAYNSVYSTNYNKGNAASGTKFYYFGTDKQKDVKTLLLTKTGAKKASELTGSSDSTENTQRAFQLMTGFSPFVEDANGNFVASSIGAAKAVKSGDSVKLQSAYPNDTNKDLKEVIWDNQNDANYYLQKSTAVEVSVKGTTEKKGIVTNVADATAVGIDPGKSDYQFYMQAYAERAANSSNVASGAKPIGKVFRVAIYSKNKDGRGLSSSGFVGEQARAISDKIATKGQALSSYTIYQKYDDDAKKYSGSEYNKVTQKPNSISNVIGNSATVALSESGINRRAKTGDMSNKFTQGEQKIGISANLLARKKRITTSVKAVRVDEEGNLHGMTVTCGTKSTSDGSILNAGYNMINVGNFTFTDVSGVDAAQTLRVIVPKAAYSGNLQGIYDEVRKSVEDSGGKLNTDEAKKAVKKYLKKNGLDVSKVNTSNLGIHVDTVAIYEGDTYAIGANGGLSDTEIAGYDVLIYRDEQNAFVENVSANLDACYVNFVFPTILGDTQNQALFRYTAQYKAMYGANTNAADSVISYHDNYAGSLITANKTAQKYILFNNLKTANGWVAGGLFGLEQAKDKSFSRNQISDVALTHSINLTREYFGDKVTVSSLNTMNKSIKNSSNIYGEYLSKTLSSSEGMKPSTRASGTTNKTVQLCTKTDNFLWQTSHPIIITYQNGKGEPVTTYIDPWVGTNNQTSSYKKAGYKMTETAEKYTPGQIGTSSNSNAGKVSVTKDNTKYSLSKIVAFNNATTTFYPEVKMVTHAQLDTSSAGINDGNAYPVYVLPLYVMGEKARSLHPSAMFTMSLTGADNANNFKGDFNGTPATGTISSSVKNAKDNGNKMEVVYSGSEASVATKINDTGIVFNGFVLDLMEMNPIKVHPKKFYSTFCGSRMFLFSASPFSRNL